MSGCLGIYVQNNLIKYAKVSKDHNNVKVEAYGVKFFDNDIEKVIEQIVKETYSYQIPISVNIDKEKYAYSTVFGLLKPQDLEKAIDTEFEFFCNNNNQNKNTIEYRKVQTENLEDKDRIRVLYSYVDKTNIVQKIQLFDKYKLQNISPMPMTIPGLNKLLEQENCAIINLEENTEITTMVNGKIYKVDKIETGMKQILNLIVERENSTQRAYEICKSTTVYTKAGKNLQMEGNEYFDEIIEVLLDIIEQVKQTMVNNDVEINNIYITGMGLIINNVDLLFQESFIEKKCEILVPYFIEKTNVKINIKDYLEVNSAIALALQGLDSKGKELNFCNKGRSLKEILTSDVGKGKNPRNKKKLTAKETLKSDTDIVDNLLMHGITAALLIIIFYVAISIILVKQINGKMAETKNRINETKLEIAKVENLNRLVQARSSEYQALVDKIDEANKKISDTYLSKNAIPNLLNKIMYNIPTGVQLLSINNVSGKKIEITAQAEKYDQLGYFKAALEEEGILTNVTSTKGTKQGELIGITISGELPF